MTYFKLAELIENEMPALADLLRNARYVDDLGDSKETAEESKKLVTDADKVLESVGLKCKGWTFTGEPPHPEVSDNGSSILVGGLEWRPQIDTIEVPIPGLHFGKKVQGRILAGTYIFLAALQTSRHLFPSICQEAWHTARLPQCLTSWENTPL